MAVMMKYEWDGVTPEQYDEVRARVGWLDTPPAGGRVHVAAFDENGVHITDVWDSVDDFQAFLNTRLAPAIAQVGIQREPRVEFLPLHEFHCPLPETILATHQRV